MTTSSLYPTHTIICKVPMSSNEFQTQIQPQSLGRFSNASQRRAPIGSIPEYHFEHGEYINYTLEGVSIHPITTKIQVSFLTQLPERKETAQGFHRETNGDFITVTGENLGWIKIVVTPQLTE